MLKGNDIDFYYDSLFTLDSVYKFIINSFEYVSENITGRLAGVPHDYGVFGQAVFNSGNGNVLEIGTLFGGGAILIAMMMKKFNIEGKIYTLDPLDGYYGKGNKDDSGIIPSVDVLKDNISKFKVEDYIVIVQEKSYPFPARLSNLNFNVVYIDGDHWGDMPKKDFISVSKLTNNYIIFDNYDKSHPYVYSAVNFANCNTDWKIVHISSISCVLQKSPKIVNRFGR